MIILLWLFSFVYTESTVGVVLGRALWLSIINKPGLMVMSRDVYELQITCLYANEERCRYWCRCHLTHHTNEVLKAKSQHICMHEKHRKEMWSSSKESSKMNVVFIKRNPVMFDYVLRGTLKAHVLFVSL